MGEIFAPPALANAKSFFDLLGSFLDPKERAKIADDIKQFHSLNDTEKQKAEDARALIKRHSDVLEETKKIAEKTELDKKSVSHERIKLNLEFNAEKEKIKIEKLKAEDVLKEAKLLHNEAKNIQAKTEEKERNLKKDKEDYDLKVKQHLEDEILLNKKKKEIDNYRNEVVALDKATKDKVEKLKQFNF